MLSARTVITVVVVIFVLSVLATVHSMMRPPDQQGLGADSYGTRAHGYRALYEILAALGASEERALQPPSGVLDRSATLILWAPDDELVGNEPVYLQRVARWIHDGGRAVVALDIQGRDPLHIPRGSRPPAFSASTTELLGLPEVRPQTVDLSAPELIAQDETKAEHDHGQETDESAADDEPETSDAAELHEDVEPVPTRPDRIGGPHRPGRKKATLEEGLHDWLLPDPYPVLGVDVRGEGDLVASTSELERLIVPQELQILRVGDSQPAGTFSVVVEEKNLIVAARYNLGAGTLVLVSDPAIFDNRLISRADNSVLAARLMVGGSGPIVWDEFYHGLTIRGSILFLLTRRAYAIVAAMILLTTVAWLWRQARFLGPPLGTVPVSRRSVREYVEAMARFFKRGARSRRFMLAEVRRGVLWSLRRKTGAVRQQDSWSLHENLEPGPGRDKTGTVETGQRPPGGVQRPTSGESESPEAILAVLARHDPQACGRLREALAQADQILADGRKVGDREILQAVKGLADCL